MPVAASAGQAVADKVLPHGASITHPPALSHDREPGSIEPKAPALRRELLDQSAEIEASNSEAYVNTRCEHAQTFTAGKPGMLSRVEIKVKRSSADISAGLRLEIRKTVSGGAPGEGESSLMGNAILPASKFPVSSAEFVSFDLSGSKLFVSKDDVLAITLSTPETFPKPDSLAHALLLAITLRHPETPAKRTSSVGTGYLWTAISAGSKTPVYTHGAGFFRPQDGPYANKGWVRILGDTKAFRTYVV